MLNSTKYLYKLTFIKCSYEPPTLTYPFLIDTLGNVQQHFSCLRKSNEQLEFIPMIFTLNKYK